MSDRYGFLRLERCLTHEACIEAVGGGAFGMMRLELHFRQDVAREILSRLTVLLASDTRPTVRPTPNAVMQDHQRGPGHAGGAR